MKLIIDLVAKQSYVQDNDVEIPVNIEGLIRELDGDVFDLIVDAVAPETNEAVNLNFVEFSEETIREYTEEGIVCKNCKERFPSNTRFQNVYADYVVRIRELGEVLPPGFNPDNYSVEQWCPNCVTTHAVRPHVDRWPMYPFATRLTQYSDRTLKYYLLVDLFTCDCGRYIPMSDWQEHFYFATYNRVQSIFDLIDGGLGLSADTIGCTGCLSTENAYIGSYNFQTERGDFKVNFAHRKVWPVHEELIVADTEEDITEDTIFMRGKFLQFNLVEATIEKNDVLIPLHIMRQLEKTLCPCGMVSNNPEVCAPCRTTEGDYLPISETVEI